MLGAEVQQAFSRWSDRPHPTHAAIADFVRLGTRNTARPPGAKRASPQ